MLINSEIKEKPCRNKNCDAVFKPFKTTDRFCSHKCAIEYENDRKSNNKPKIYRIPNRSKKRAKEERVYLSKNIVFLSKPENKWCRVFPNKRATEVHHMKGRIGKLLLDERFWLPVSSDGHKKIEENPIWAKENGFSLNRL